MKLHQSSFANKTFNKLIILIGKFYGKKIKILKHNGINLLNYPEKSWTLVPFPAQKGDVFNTDNLATVNRHNFLSNPKFLAAKNAAESRWIGVTVRDISWRLNVILWASGRALKIANEDAIFIECGTGRGYMAAAIAEYHNFKSHGTCFFLIDNFSASLINCDGVVTPSPASFAYSDDVLEVKEYFKCYQSVEIIKGLIPEVLQELPNKPIAFLHVDLNNAIAERAALQQLRNRLLPGAIIVFDDYGGPGGNDQSLIHEAFANENEKDLLILPTGQAIIVW